MKHFFVLVFLVSTLNLFAQEVNPTQKGNLMLGGGGSLGYGSELGDDSSTGTLSFSLYPSIGFFLSDGFALGFGPSFGISAYFSEYGYTSLATGGYIFLVKYFGSGIFIRGSTGYRISHRFESSYYGEANTGQSITIIPEVGYAFFLGPNVALELSLQSTFNIIIGDLTSYRNQTYVSAGFQIFL